MPLKKIPEDRPSRVAGLEIDTKSSVLASIGPQLDKIVTQA